MHSVSQSALHAGSTLSRGASTHVRFTGRTFGRSRTVIFGIHDECSSDFPLSEWAELADDLAGRLATRPPYALEWSRNLGRGRLAVCSVHRDGRLVALAPLHLRNRLGVPVLRMPAHGLGTVGTFLATDREALRALLDGIAGRRMALHLDFVPLDDPLHEELRASPRWVTEVAHDDVCLTIDVPAGAGAEAMRGTRTLKTLRRVERSLERQGTPMRVELVRDPDHLAARWSDIVGVAAAADENSGRDDFCAPPIASFTKPMLDAEARAGRLLVAGLLVGGRWCAHEIMFRTGSTAEMWMGRFHPDVRRRQPGQLLYRWLTDHHDELGIDRFDFLLGASEFKSQWANGEYRVGSIVAVPSDRPHFRPVMTVADRSAALLRSVRDNALEAVRGSRE